MGVSQVVGRTGRPQSLPGSAVGQGRKKGWLVHHCIVALVVVAKGQQEEEEVTGRHAALVAVSVSAEAALLVPDLDLLQHQPLRTLDFLQHHWLIDGIIDRRINGLMDGASRGVTATGEEVRC